MDRRESIRTGIDWLFGINKVNKVQTECFTTQAVFILCRYCDESLVPIKEQSGTPEECFHKGVPVSL